MDNLKNLVKLGVAVVAIGLLVAATFFAGYQAGKGNEAQRVENAAEDIVSSETQPMPATATDTASPTKTPADQVLLPSDTPISPTSTAEPTVTSAPAPTEEAAVSDQEALQVLEEVWDLIDAEFFGELPPPNERVYGAIRGMLATLDDENTTFTEPSRAEIRRSDASGSFEGIGAFVALNEDGILEIVQPFRGSPADRAGLLPGDQVLAVDGESIVGYDVFDAITLIRGPEGTEVILTIRRAGEETFDVSIVRARLDIPIVESEMLEGSIGYVALVEFSSPAASRLEEAIEELFDQGATALIFDLRGNPGGFLDQAVQVADLFLEEGLVLTERRGDGEEIQFTSGDKGLAQEVALVVLVNGGSASASEIVAGAIQDRGRGTLIGETTFGKGSVQVLHMLSDGSELRVTVARWFTPNDNAIHGEGLVPDIEVLLSPEDREAGRDPQLEHAIDFLSGER